MKAITIMLVATLAAGCGASASTMAQDARSDSGEASEGSAPDDARAPQPEAAPGRPAPAADSGPKAGHDAGAEAAAPEAGTPPPACTTSWTDVCTYQGGAPIYCGPMGPPACGYDCGNGTPHYTPDPQVVVWTGCADAGATQVLIAPWQTCGVDHLVHCANAETCQVAPIANYGTIVCDGETYRCGPDVCP